LVEGFGGYGCPNGCAENAGPENGGPENGGPIIPEGQKVENVGPENGGTNFGSGRSLLR